MTISELFAAVLMSVAELLERITLAFERTFNLIAEGRLGQLVLSDIAIVGVMTFVGLIVVLSVLSAVYWWLVETLVVARHEDPSDDDVD